MGIVLGLPYAQPPGILGVDRGAIGLPHCQCLSMARIIPLLGDPVLRRARLFRLVGPLQQLGLRKRDDGIGRVCLPIFRTRPLARMKFVGVQLRVPRIEGEDMDMQMRLIEVEHRRKQDILRHPVPEVAQKVLCPLVNLGPVIIRRCEVIRAPDRM